MQPQGRQRRDLVQMLLGPGDGGIEGDYNRRRSGSPRHVLSSPRLPNLVFVNVHQVTLVFLVDWLVGFFL